MNLKAAYLATAFALGSLGYASDASAEVITDLSDWVVEKGPDETASWAYDEATNTWSQSVNTNWFTYLYDPSGEALGKAISGTISVDTTGDDDFIGFVVGYEAGEIGHENADYLLLTWKQATQGNLPIGMDLYHITGSLARGEADYGLALENVPYAQQLGNSKDYANTGWEDYESYTFDIAYDHHYLAVFVNGVLQYAATPEMIGAESFSDGGFGFFNYSQHNVTYGGVQYDDVEVLLDDDKKQDIVSAVPVPGVGMLGATLFFLPGVRRRVLGG